MVALTGFLVIYLLGGLTFTPLVLAVIYLHWRYSTRKVPADEASKAGAEASASDADPANNLTELPEELKKYVQGRRHEADVASGYFAVCREYVPGGVNGKPPERMTPAGTVVANESPSVYQSMYRGIFGRDKNATPTIQADPGKGSVKVKKSRNVFYVVLRLGHLMLYDDEDQLEVRHVISLAHHGVDIYGGDEAIPEGELFVKRNCIRLTSKRIAGELSSQSRPFYLFSDNCSEKEDFYHALLQNQERREGSPDNPPKPLQFEQAHLIKLVQQLHASEENLQTRWLNALLGRVFLAMYKTPDIEDLIRNKITKKISRVQKPNFISSVTVGSISLGDASPFFTNPKLRELTMAGDVTVEADVKYSGGFRIEVMAVASIDLGKRMGGVRELSLLLAAVARRVEGHVLFRIKPPPSNRVWFSFETVPKMDISIEPVVAQRQIKYGFILRAIESRIREVLAETLVYPNWDDVPFHQTLLQRFRGGIWEDDVKADTAVRPEVPVDNEDDMPNGVTKQHTDAPDDDNQAMPPLLSEQGKTMSTPFLANTAPTGLIQRNRAASRTSPDLFADVATSSGVDSDKPGLTTTDGPSKPRALRSHSLASVKAAEPMLQSEPITIIPKERSASGGASSLKSLNARQSLSRSSSPQQSPIGSPERAVETAELMRQAVRSNKGSVGSIRSNLSATSHTDTTASREESSRSDTLDRESSSPSTRTSLESITSRTLHHLRSGSTDIPGVTDLNLSTEPELEPVSKQAKRAATLKSLGANAAEKRQSLNAAAAAAKRWGLGVIAAKQNAKASGATPPSPRQAITASLGDPDAEYDDGPGDVVTSPESTNVVPQEEKLSTPTSARASLVMEAEHGLERVPSPSMIPRRIGSVHSLSSTSSTSTNKPHRQSSPQPSKIPTLSSSTSNSSLNKSVSSSTDLGGSLSPSSFSNPALAPSQQEIDSRLSPRHSRNSSIGGVSQGPGSPSMPLGRGQPLPPPGKPLPGPKGGTWVGAAGAMLSNMRRKPVGAVDGARSTSIDEGRQQAKSLGRQQLDAKRKQYEQEKHLIGATAPRSSHDSPSEQVDDDLTAQDRKATNGNPPPLPKRPDVTAAALDGKDRADAELDTPSFAAPKRTSSIPVTKRPVPKPPLPSRHPVAHDEDTQPLNSSASEQEVRSEIAIGEPNSLQNNRQLEASQHKLLERLDPDAILQDEEELASGPAAVETRPAEDEDEREAGLSADSPQRDSGSIETEIASEDDDEAFGPMEMNAPEVPSGLHGHGPEEGLPNDAR